MATTIPEWVPKFIRQVVAYREKQKVTHARLNELFNLLIVQGDWNTETIQTLLANLKSFDLQYIADLDGMSADYAALVSTFNNTINQIKQENTSNIAALDLQQRQLMAEQLVTFQADLADTETAINTMLTDKLGAIQILHDEMLAQSDFFNTEMADLRLTVDTLRATILDDNQAIADKIAADRLAIENMIAISQETVQHASELTQAITNLETTTAEHEHTLGEYDSRLLGLALENVDQDTALNTLNNNLAPLILGLHMVKNIATLGNNAVLSHTMSVSDFNSEESILKDVNTYLLLTTNWATSPSTGLYLISYSGGSVNNAVLTPIIAQTSAIVGVSGGVISASGTSRIRLYAFS